MTHRVKILFEYGGNSPSTVEIESMWAIPVDGGFKLDNIPFFVQGLALDDVVSAERDSTGMLRFTSVVSYGRHSTVRLWFAKEHEGQVSRVRQRLRELGCPSELSDLPRLVAVDIPPGVPYVNVQVVLDKYERDGVFEYEEACLADN